MKTVYLSYDGRQFDDEQECLEYEFTLKCPGLNTIELYNSDGNRLNNPLREETYNIVEKIVVYSSDGVQALHNVAEHTGFYLYKDIDSVGEWLFEFPKNSFVKKTYFNKGISDKYLEMLKSGYLDEIETDHINADKILTDLLRMLGYDDIIEEYEKLPKLYA